jgi:hypothetical protein
VIIGDPSIFAIESGITQAYVRSSWRALGFFVLHIGGRRFGVCEPDATMMGCSFDTVQRRLAERGRHTASFANEPDGARIADSFRSAVYGEEQDERYFGIPLTEFRDLFCLSSNDLMWAPDGDEAFDDGSFVLQFDVQERVRLIAFRSGEGYVHDLASLSDVWLPADKFYGVLELWHQSFENEWTAMPKA